MSQHTATIIIDSAIICSEHVRLAIANRAHRGASAHSNGDVSTIEFLDQLLRLCCALTQRGMQSDVGTCFSERSRGPKCDSDRFLIAWNDRKPLRLKGRTFISSWAAVGWSRNYIGKRPSAKPCELSRARSSTRRRGPADRAMTRTSTERRRGSRPRRGARSLRQEIGDIGPFGPSSQTSLGSSFFHSAS